MADVHGRFVRTLAHSENKGRAMGVAVHWHSQRAFWTDTVNKKVCRDTAAFGFHPLALVTLNLLSHEKNQNKNRNSEYTLEVSNAARFSNLTSSIREAAGALSCNKL